MPPSTSPEHDSPAPLPSQPAARKRKVMVSSTAQDLPEHRPHVLDACLRQSFDPIMMEHLTAMDANAIQASLDMVVEADVYLGIFAYRYGWVPAYHFSGHPRAAVPLFRRACDVARQADLPSDLSDSLFRLSAVEILTGAVRSAEFTAFSALHTARERDDYVGEAMSLLWLGVARATRNALASVFRTLHRSQKIFKEHREVQCVGLVTAFRAEIVLHFDDVTTAQRLADQAWKLAAVSKYEADFIRAARLQGTAALRCSGGSPESEQASRPLYEVAHERLHHALTRARACDRVDEELPTLIALAELHEALARGIGFQPVVSPSAVAAREESEQKDQERQAGSLSHGDGTLGSPLGRREPESLTTSLQLTPAEHLDQAERLLDDVWDRAERGPYPLFQADAFNRLASLERTRAALFPADSPERTAALDRAGKAALRAYEKAWLDGPPFAYAYGLSNATAHLADLGLTPPNLPPYDDSKFPPMPDEPVVRTKSSE